MTPEKQTIENPPPRRVPAAPFITDMPDKLPTPSTGKSGGGKLFFVTVAILFLLGGAAFWLTRDAKTRESLQEQAVSVLDNLTQGTPLASLNSILRESRPMPPVGEAARNKAGGSSGRTVQGTVSAPVDRTLPPEMNPSANSPAVVVLSPSGAPVAVPQTQQAVAPKVTADTTVRPDFIDDLAAYIVSRYKPGTNSGALAVNIQSLNQHYGTRMTGLAAASGQNQGNRAAILRYVFSPTMLQGLYSLYADRFQEALQRQCEAKNFTREQSRQFFMALAGRCVVLAGGLEGVAALPDLSDRLKNLDTISQGAVNVNSEIMQLVFELDQLREDKAPQSRIEEMQARVNGLGARYRAALQDRGAAQRLLLTDIRKGGGQTLDDDTLFFLARWVERRLHDMPQSMPSVGSAAGILRDLARRCAQAGQSGQSGDLSRGRTLSMKHGGATR